MPTEITLAIISGTVAILVATISKTTLFERKHASLRKDVELYKELPQESQSRQRLLKLIDSKVLAYATQSTLHKRSWSDVSAGLILLAAGGYLTWFFYDLGTWWRIAIPVTIFLAFAGAFALVQGLRKLERDEKGKPIQK
jgi:hypothetical protein